MAHPNPGSDTPANKPGTPTPSSRNPTTPGDLPQAWTAGLDELGIPHTGIVDEAAPIAYSTVIFRDPDNIQLELIAED